MILQSHVRFHGRQAAWQACSCSCNTCSACGAVACSLQSELAFRMLCRKEGSTLAYMPMLHSWRFLGNAKHRDEQPTNGKEDRWAG